MSSKQLTPRPELDWSAFDHEARLDKLYRDYHPARLWWLRFERHLHFVAARFDSNFRCIGARLLKRALDIFIAAAFLILLAPLLAVVAIAIKLHDGGPVLFWQTRVGRWGKNFRFPKFRSMVVDAETQCVDLAAQNDHGQSVTFKMKADPRVTAFGRILRKYSIDELPQLWCVLTGSMSLVGPRPALTREVAQYDLEHRRRLDVVPGLTCIWQVSGRGDIPFQRQCEMDVDYIEQQSFLRDFVLLLKTIPTVLFGRGAY